MNGLQYGVVLVEMTGSDMSDWLGHWSSRPGECSCSYDRANRRADLVHGCLLRMFKSVEQQRTFSVGYIA